MGLHALIAVAVVVGAVVALMIGVTTAEVIFASATAVLMATGVLTPKEALGGFGSVAVITIAELLVLAAAVRRTGILHVLADRLFGRGVVRAPLLRLVLPAGAVSAFMNNTPVVAMFVPVVIDWCKRHNLAPSRMLMPLAFAATLGGMTTLIGTSATLVVDGMMREAGLAPMGLFEIGKVGLPLAVFGALLIWLLAGKLLPDRRDPVGDLSAERRQYFVEMLVQRNSPLVGKSIAEAGLRNLPGLFLMSVQREGSFLGPVGPELELAGEDRLVFTGVASTVVDLRRFVGLAPAPENHYDPTASDRRNRLFEVVISSSSPLVGTTAKDIGFRRRYDAAVIALHRSGQRLPMKIGEVPLRAGDTLMIEAPEDFDRRWQDSVDFALISRVRGEPPPKARHARRAVAILFAVLVAVGTGWLPMVTAAALGVVGMLVGRVLTPREARKAIDLPVLIVIASAMALGRALEKSGVASVLAEQLVYLGKQFGPVGVLGSTMVAAILLTELLTNAAAAALVFPVAIAAAQNAGCDPRPFAFAVAIGVSASFLTPIGYQTNMMIFGPGGYRFFDFWRLGLPLVAGVVAISLVVIPHVWPLLP